MAAVALIALLLAVTVGVTMLGSVVISRHRAHSAADLAALAGAATLVTGRHDACATAGSVAASNSVTLTDCAIDGLDVLVAVEVGTALPGGSAQARARAGPGRPA
ncbi:hypothetical protein BST17_13610 [Mycolicibacterium bacteremicum]|uniref:Putative Flp pilus-assembly TadG-like N-terminal domain-containing protein n=1 Tax=Mycolicibacterium bacteremicum TaxID=564198 RepID=A0A1W9YXH2_MYCBA|nr:hypothetical protein BST17_13610 [Mycolicibacterium bacteremicum]